MSGDAKEFRFRYVTVAVLVVVGVAITLANVSSEAVSGDLIKRIANRPQRAYGWPLTWYWRVASTVPGIKPLAGYPARPLLQWPVARYSPSRLTADVAIWLVILTGTGAAVRRLLGRHDPRLRYRPRLTTLLVLLAIAAPIVLANLTFELSWSSLKVFEQGTSAKALFGWPLIWNWYFVAPFDNVYGWDFSALRLAGNIAIWVATLALMALAWEWFLRRHRPRLNFSLRTMLAAVALTGVVCAWFAMVQKRAQEQDALVESIGSAGNLSVERWGPKWLGLVVPDRIRRRVVGAKITVGQAIWPDEDESSAEAVDEDPQDHEQQNSEIHDDGSDAYVEDTAEEEDRRDQEILERLGRLPALHFLQVECGLLTPAMSDALAKLRQLRMLEVRGQFFGRPPRLSAPNVAWLGHLRQLEQLSLQGVDSEQLVCLANLTRLESLTLDITDCEDDEREMDKRLAMIDKLTQLRRLHIVGFPGAQIARLRSLNNLKSLTLDFDRIYNGRERVHECFETLGRVTQLEQLQLGSGGGLHIYSEDLACLRGLKNLKSLRVHMSRGGSERHACLAALANLTQLRRLWLEGELVSAGLADLAPLESLEELTSDYRMATPAALESMTSLKHLKAVHIAGLDLDLDSSTEKGAAVRRAVESLRRSRPGILVDGDYNGRWLDAQKEDYPSLRWEPFDDKTSELDAFLGFVPMVP